MSYHITEIPRGTLGEVSKITEEYLEFMDAGKQRIAIMQLVELSDLMGAIEKWLEKYHPNVTLNELCKMKDATGRAFASGHRKPKNTDTQENTFLERARSLEAESMADLGRTISKSIQLCPTCLQATIHE